MAKVNTMQVIREQQKIQEQRMTQAFIRFTSEDKREIPDGIIASMLKIAAQNTFTSGDDAYEKLKTLFEVYDFTKKELKVVDAKD